MEDPEILITILKLLLFAVMIGGAIAVFRELIPMARGTAPPRTRDDAHE